MARMTVDQFSRMQELQALADAKSISKEQGAELVRLVGMVASTTHGARESVKASGLTMATEEQLATMAQDVNYLVYGLEYSLRYGIEGILYNVMERYNNLAIKLKMQTYDSPLDLYNALDDLPAIFAASVEQGREKGRKRGLTSFSREIEKINEREKTPEYTPTQGIV